MRWWSVDAEPVHCLLWKAGGRLHDFAARVEGFSMRFTKRYG